MSFVHLHTHSEYSLLDGAARVSDLVLRAREYGMPSLALTDHGYMYGAVDFYRTAVNAPAKVTYGKGKDAEKRELPPVKPILGCEVYFTAESRLTRGGKRSLYHLLLLAKNNEGYRNLRALVSAAAVEGFYYKPQVDMELLERYSDGLIGTSACMSGIVSKSIELGMAEEAREWAKRYAQVFAPGDFYLEIQDQGITSDNGVTQTELAAEIASIASETGLGLVTTNDIHYLTRKDAETQDLLLCLGTGTVLDDTKRMKFSCDEFYMKSQEEMHESMAAYPEALANTLEIAERCNVSMDFGKLHLPVFEVPDLFTPETYLRDRCIVGLKERYGDPVPDDVLERLDYELGVINEKGFAPYFLITADFVRWAKAQEIGVGPGRGSAAGSIVAYSLGITMLDPIENDLLFERFLNPERSEMPDIDIDFDDARRGEVIDYVRDKYGDDHVAQIITFGTMKTRSAIRDAGRVLGYPFGIPDRISKMIPDQPLGITINQAMYGDKDEGVSANPDLLQDFEDNLDTKRILESAMSLEGIVRGEGVHAAGVVICPDPVFEHVPVKYDTKGGAVITQWDGPTVAELGLLKMDFLGLRTLTVIANAISNIRENHGVKIDPDQIPKDDPKLFELLRRGDTVGVFQVESSGMRQLLKRMKPETFADVVAILALYRPGPLGSGMVDDFVERKSGRRKVTYYDERLKPILEETYGAIVYQEQVMRISMEMSGFSAAKADKLRKAMGKKLKDVLAKLKTDWIEGASANGYAPKLAESMWNDIEPFAEYAFNKSHSAAYGLITMQTAYLKAHYPTEYMAAVLTSYQGKTDNIVKYIAACNRAGMTVLPPDVNSSRRDFTAVPEGIRFGLAGIRGVGEGVVETIVAERENAGPFASLHDFCARVPMKQMNKKTLEALIKGGAFDSTGYTRKHLMQMMDPCVDSAVQRQKDQENGQVSMFDMFAEEDHGFAEKVPEPNGDEWDKKIKLAFEKEMLGIYVSDHPLSDIAEAIRRAADHSLGAVDDVKRGSFAWFAGILTSVERKPTRKGTMMAVVKIEDLEGGMEAVLFPAIYDKFRDLIVEDAVLRIRAKLESDDRGRKLIVQDVQAFDGEAFSRPPGKVVVETEAAAFKNGRVDRLKEILGRYPGKDTLELHLTNAESTEVWACGQVDGKSNGLHAELMEVFGGAAVREAG